MMQRVSMAIVGLLVGLAFALVMLVVFVDRPASCGEPAACGDDYLFPAAYFALASAIGFPALGLYSGGANSWRSRFRPMALCSIVLAFGILMVRALGVFTHHA